MASQPLTADMIAYYKAHADDTLQPNLIAAGVCGLIIAYAAVTARVFARRASGPKFGWDDWLILASLVCRAFRLSKAPSRTCHFGTILTSVGSSFRLWRLNTLQRFDWRW